MNMQKLLKKFQREFKHKIEIRSNRKNPPERLLLDAFKYYDIKKTELVDFNTFSKIIKIKFGVNIFSEEDITMIFDHYLQILNSTQNEFFYKEFVAEFYGINIPQSVKQEDNQSSYTHTKSFTGNKHDTYDESKEVQKLLQYIIFKLRKKDMSLFMQMYAEMKKQDLGGSNFITLDNLSSIFKKFGVELQEENVEKIWTFFTLKKGCMEYPKFWEFICINFNQARINSVKEAFDKLDLQQNKQVALNLLIELFNAKNHEWVKTGRLTTDEIQYSYEKVVKAFKQIYPKHHILDIKKFKEFFQMISPSFEHDKDFKSFIENCYRYNELRNLQNFKSKQAKSRMNYDNHSQATRSELVSVRTDQQPSNVMLILEEQISKKGNKGYVNFYKSLRGNDHDNDNLIYLKEWKKCLSEARVNIKDKQATSLFNHFSSNTYQMNYDLLLQKLVPQCSDQRLNLLKDLYSYLMNKEKTNELSFYRLQNSFLPRQHPDFRSGYKPDYEIKTEFLQSVQSFLVNFQGNHMKVPLFALVRFFEFFARDWSDEYFETIINQCFGLKKRKKEELSNINLPPFSTEEDLKSKKSNKSKLYKEFDKQYTPKYPYYVDDKANFKKKESNVNVKEESQQQQPSMQKSNVNQNNQPQQQQRQPQINYHEMRSHLSNKTRTVRESSKIERSHRHDNYKRELSPGDGSMISYPQDQLSAFRLNKQIQDTLVEKEQRIYDNVNDRELGLQNPQTKLSKYIINSKRFPVILELEYELTNLSDNKGHVNFQNFEKIFKQLGLTQALSSKDIKDLFKFKSENNNLVHVQTFANELRDQMSEEQENIVIDLFDRLCMKSGSDTLKVDNLRKAFLPTEFTYSNDKNVSNVKEMFDYLVDLFVCLNLSIKNRNYFDLDDFLYMFDNFAFFIDNNQVFKKMTKTCFK